MLEAQSWWWQRELRILAVMGSVLRKLSCWVLFVLKLWVGLLSRGKLLYGKLLLLAEEQICVQP